MLPDTEADVAALRGLLLEILGACEVGEGRGVKIGRAADDLGKKLGQLVQAHTGRLPGGFLSTTGLAERKNAVPALLSLISEQSS